MIKHRSLNCLRECKIDMGFLIYLIFIQMQYYSLGAESLLFQTFGTHIIFILPLILLLYLRWKEAGLI
jgi:hypothetical protein